MMSKDFLELLKKQMILNYLSENTSKTDFPFKPSQTPLTLDNNGQIVNQSKKSVINLTAEVAGLLGLLRLSVIEYVLVLGNKNKLECLQMTYSLVAAPVEA